jgi:hypothetical protein
LDGWWPTEPIQMDGSTGRVILEGSTTDLSVSLHILLYCTTNYEILLLILSVTRAFLCSRLHTGTSYVVYYTTVAVLEVPCL